MPGCNRDPFIELLKEKCEEEEKEISIHHIFDYLIAEAQKQGKPINKKTILDFYDASPENMITLREKAIDTICDEISENEGVHIISSPNYFEWRGSNLDGFRDEDLDKLSLDLIIIVTDDLTRIKERLFTDDQWKDQKYSYGSIAKWRRDCIDNIWKYSYSKDPAIKTYLVAVEHDIDVVYDLIFNPEKQTAYLSYPITGVPPEIVAEERKLAKTLSSKFVVFDPLTIKDMQLVYKWKKIQDEGTPPVTFECEIEYKEGTKKFECNSHEIELAIKDIRHQIVDRDYKLIEQSDCVLVYHPREAVSVGVVCEMIHGKMGGQFVYAVYPFEPSPFFEYHATRIFKTKEEFLAFLDIEE